VNGTRSGQGDGGRCSGATRVSVSEEKAPVAWQPLTARGVAAFARAPSGRLLLVQLIVALLAAGTAVSFLHTCWFPTIGAAIRGLPPQGTFRSGTLDWPEPSPVCLAEGRFLALVVDLDHAGQVRSPAQVQVEFGRQNLKIYSLLGSVQCAYPRGATLPFNRNELGPWWGAWGPALLAVAGGLVAGGLMVCWTLLAALYCLPAWLIGFFANCDCSLAGCWRMAGAALMPGALLLCGVVFLYGWGTLDLVRLAVGGAAHLVVGWGYLLFSLLSLPRRPAAPAKANPFT
jgi:hypothetical protein